jgi:hypothetical protein
MHAVVSARCAGVVSARRAGWHPRDALGALCLRLARGHAAGGGGGWHTTDLGGRKYVDGVNFERS